MCHMGGKFIVQAPVMEMSCFLGDRNIIFNYNLDDNDSQG
jgi:hypothetical protein